MPDSLSLIPLHLETFYDNKQNGILHTSVKVSDATGFVFRKQRDEYLITNWHVVTGRNPATGRPLSKKAAIPNLIKVYFHSLVAGCWAGQSLELLDWETDEKLWIEHIRGKAVDVVALPLKNNIHKTYPLDNYLFNSNLKILPSEPVSIVGFPFGMPSVGGLPIWKTGHVASDIDGDYDGKPVFLIDATARPGMSGSPVIARRKEFLSEDNSMLITLESLDKFLGIFSGGISKKHDCEIGMVWKPEIINEIIEGRDEIMKKIVKYEWHKLF